MNRRNFLSTTLATSAVPFVVKMAPEPKKTVRLAFIGTGYRGRNHIEQVLYRPDVEITAICDIDPSAIGEAVKICKKFNGVFLKKKSRGGGGRPPAKFFNHFLQISR